MGSNAKGLPFFALPAFASAEAPASPTPMLPAAFSDVAAPSRSNGVGFLSSLIAPPNIAAAYPSRRPRTKSARRLVSAHIVLSSARNRENGR